MQVKEDVYEKIDKELLEYVEDVLLNRCENATERLLEFAATLEPKSKPCKVVRKGAAPELKLSAKVRIQFHKLLLIKWDPPCSLLKSICQSTVTE